MSKFNVSLQNVNFENDILSFKISGSESFGLDKSMINCIRRTILTDIPTVAFRVDENNVKDIKVNENTGSIHNEMLLQRISLIPLYINPQNYHNNYLFELKVKHDNSNIYKFVTAKDFNIYPLIPKIQQRVDEIEDGNINPELKDILESKNIENYDLKNPLSEKKKENIFRPFIFKKEKNYCLITELKNTNTENMQQTLDLYGVPSLSTGKEHSRYQSVSLANYTFVKDQTMIDSVISEKISLENVPEEKQEEFARKITLSESERYYKRDIDNEPYEYEFSIKSVHYLESGEIFMKSIELIIDKLDNIKLQCLNLLKDKKSSISVNKKNDILYDIIMYNEGHTMGNLIQSHIVRRCINEESMVQLCGYKRTHPLEECMILFISLNPGHKIIKESETNKFQMIMTFIMEELNVLKEQFKTILKSSEESDLIKGSGN